jgi:hypothetical protein
MIPFNNLTQHFLRETKDNKKKILTAVTEKSTVLWDAVCDVTCHNILPENPKFYSRKSKCSPDLFLHILLVYSRNERFLLKLAILKME